MPKLRKLLGWGTMITFIIGCCVHKISALRCYYCDGVESCATDKLGKNGTLRIGQNDEEVYGIKECDPASAKKPVHIGSEYCYSIPSRKGVRARGCSFISKFEDWSPEYERADCPLSPGKIESKYPTQCNCVTDLCNGEPLDCC